jgi:hypothetical protein
VLGKCFKTLFVRSSKTCGVTRKIKRVSHFFKEKKSTIKSMAEPKNRIYLREIHAKLTIHIEVLIISSASLTGSECPNLK